MKKCIPDLFNILYSDKIKNCAENHASPEQFLRVIWEIGCQAIVVSLAQTKLFSILIIVCLLIIFIDTGDININIDSSETYFENHC